MINLLPPQASKQLRASRHNTILLRYLIGMCIVLVLTIIVYAVTYMLMKRTELQSVSASADNKQKIAAFKDTETKAKDYTNDLKIAKSIFDGELSYTTALHKIARALPAGAVIETLDLNPTTVGQPITLSVSAKDQATALSVKATLEKENVASNITIASLQEHQAAEAQEPSSYPVQISLNLTLNKEIFIPGDNDE